jgi:hypothetical protein
MRPTGSQGATDLSDAFGWIENVFEYILGNDEVERSIGKCLLFEIFTSEALMTLAPLHVRKEMSLDAPLAFSGQLLGRRTARRRFVDVEVSPVWEEALQNEHEGSPTRDAGTTSAPELVA